MGRIEAATRPRIVLAGRSPCFQPLLEAALAKPGIDLVGVFHDPVGDPRITSWLVERGIAGPDLAVLGDAVGGAAALRELRPDRVINFNATVLFAPEVLAVPTDGCLNLHPGLLPEYAGLHTHQWAIREGAARFGATLHRMEARFDAGDVVYRESFPLDGRETGLSLYLDCLRVGRALTERALDRIAAGEELPRERQDLSRRRVYLHREALDGVVRWTWSSDRILRFFRAADYGPFGSPTYRPETSAGERRLELRGAEAGGAASAGPPGEVLTVAGEWVEVRCGDERSVRVRVGEDGAAVLVPGTVLG